MRIELTITGQDAGELRASLLGNVIDAADRITLLTGVKHQEVLRGLIQDLEHHPKLYGQKFLK